MRYTLGSLAIVATLALPVGQAASKSTTSGSALAMLHDVAGRARHIALDAGDLDSVERNQQVLEASFLRDFELIKDEINHAGSELRQLETERASLEPWQRHALDRIEPLFASMARDETHLIEFYNEHHPYLVDPEFKSSIDQLYQESGEAATILTNYLKLAKLHDAERRLAPLAS